MVLLYYLPKTAVCGKVAATKLDWDAMKKKLITPFSLLAQRQEQLKLATGWIMLIAVGIALGLIAQMVLGSYFTTPNFWELPHLVHLAAESLMLVLVLFVCCSPLGYLWPLSLIILDGYLILLIAHLRQLRRVPPAFRRVAKELQLHHQTSVKATQLRLQTAIEKREPPGLSASNAPFRLFRQAPLLVAP
jgi:MFS family permease